MHAKRLHGGLLAALAVWIFAGRVAEWAAATGC